MLALGSQGEDFATPHTAAAPLRMGARRERRAPLRTIRAGIAGAIPAGMRTGARLRWPLVGLAVLSACSYHVLSPPSRALPLESPRVLPVGANAIAAEAAYSDTTFDPAILSAALRYRRGLDKALDGSLDLTLLHVTGRPSSLDTWPQAYALRLGLKYQLTGSASLQAGLGGGASAAGGFISPDVGLSVGYENRHLVPFVSVRGFLSQPIRAQRVHLGEEDEVERFSTPQTTWGASGALGVRIPFEQSDELTHSLALGVGVIWLCDAERCGGYFSLGAGFEGVYGSD